MEYIIENGKSHITVRKEKESARVYILSGQLSIYEVLRVFAENAVEPCHAQNVYDDLTNK